MARLTYNKTVDGINAVVLENEQLRCVCLPEFGGKIASIYEKQKGFELLFQNPKPAYRHAAIGDHFGDYEACGFDDAFPNIDAGVVQTPHGEIQYFDHGEIWSARFHSQIDGENLTLSYESPYLGYHYEKTLSLLEDTITIQYRITNRSDRSFPCIWACHCLVNYSEDMQIVFPNGTQRIQTVMDTPLLGDANSIYRFPKDTIDGRDYDFTSVPPMDGKTMLKYYCADTVLEGVCGYRYPSQGIEARIRYDSSKLPYLGFWLTAGGYRGDCNCALEPTNGFFDSIEIAQKNKKCPELNPGEENVFSISISLAEL